METTVDGRHFATPRGWEDLSNLIQVYERLKKPVDREVVVQYIQFPKIAKDFANYLELYYKYRTDYQIEEILKGHLDPILLKKVAHASFDERLSVLGLLLSRVQEALKASVQTENYMELLQNSLLEYKELTQTVTEGMNGQKLLSNVYEKYNMNYRKRKKAELLGKEENIQYHKLLSSLEIFLQTLKLEHIDQASAAFQRVKQLFEQENKIFEKQRQSASEILEYAFDFLEAAFGNSQEMVMFITELNSNSSSVSFLQQYECERYYRYNKELLFDEKRRSLLERIS